MGRVGERAPSIRGVKKKNSQWKLSSPLFVCVVGAVETKRTESEGGRRRELNKVNDAFEGCSTSLASVVFFFAFFLHFFFPPPFHFGGRRLSVQPDVTSGRREDGLGRRTWQLFSFSIDGECERITGGLNILPGNTTCFAPTLGDSALL